MRRKSDRVKTPVAASPAKRSSRRSKRSASDTEEKPQNSDNEQSEQNSGSEPDSDHQPIAKNRKKLSRNTKQASNDEKPAVVQRSRRGRPAKNIETVTEEDEETESLTQQPSSITVTTECNSNTAEKSPSPEPVNVNTKSPGKTIVETPTSDPTPIVVEEEVEEVVASAKPIVTEPIEEEKAISDTIDRPTEINSQAVEQSERNNGSNEKSVTPSDNENERVKENVDEKNKVKPITSKEQPATDRRRRHRRSSSENADPQPTEVKESPRKRRNRFNSPETKEPDNNQMIESEVNEAMSTVEEGSSTVDCVVTDATNNSKSREPEAPKDVDKSQDGDGKKSRGEKENKDKKRTDDKVAIGSSERKQKPVRKRKWLTQKSTEPKPQILAISTDSLKNLISDVKPVPLSDVKLESSPEPEEVEIVSKSEHSAKSTNDLSERTNRSNRDHRNESKQDKKQDESASMNSTNRKISIVTNDDDDDATAVQRPPSPPKFSSSNILFITNLVRPFTVLQLKGLLARTGKIMDDGFWIDKIKSKCYVKYETEDEAIETRHALHGVRWPASNPKCLNVDFGSEKNMDKAVASTSEQPPKETARDDRVTGGWERFEVDERKESTVTTRPMREWDVGKKEDLGRERDKERDGRGDRSHREREREHPKDLKESRDVDRLERRKRTPDNAHSVSPPRKFHKKENEPPIRLLDDLFRKTKTVPCVYWLPLTSEQIAHKEEEKRKQQAEHKRRIEQREKERNERNERDRERDRNSDRNRDRDRGDRDRDRRRY